MQRRDFLKDSCRICMLGAMGATAINIAGCSPSVGNAMAGNNALSPEVIDNSVQIPLSLFDKLPVHIISPKKYAYEVAVEKQPDGTYKALLLKCTHFANQLQPSATGFSCNLHGSRFNKEGSVIKGPAAQPLKQLQTSISQQNLLISLIK